MYTLQLPSGIQAEIREMTGREEELLTNERLIRTGDAINKVFESCLVRLDEKTDVKEADILDLLAGDRLTLLFELRKVSLGADLTLSLTCPNRSCQHKQLVSIDLDDLPVKPFPEEREFQAILPSGKNVTFCHLTGHHEKRMAALDEPNVTTAILMRIMALDGKPPNKKSVSGLSFRDRAALRREMKAVDGGVDSQVEANCQKCGSQITTRIEVEPDFLFPDLR